MTEPAKPFAERRMDICRTCENFKPRTTRCSRCGCFMQFKTLIKSAKCPIGKWDKE